MLTLVLAPASTALADAAVYFYPAEELHLPGTSHAQLNGVICPSGGYCVAVGTSGAAGGGPNTLPVVLDEEPTINRAGEASWHVYSPALPTPSNASTYNALESVACIGPGSCLAVGAYGAGGDELPLVEEGSDAGAWTPGGSSRSRPRTRSPPSRPAWPQCPAFRHRCSWDLGALRGPA